MTRHAAPPAPRIQTVEQWAVLHPDGDIEKISDSSANEGYMTAAEYAQRRAEATPGARRIRRCRTTMVTTTAWEET